MGKSSLGTAWTEADIQHLWDLRQAKKSWVQIGHAINRTGGAAQQQWMRMQREKHPLLANEGTGTPVIATEAKEEAPSDEPDGKCKICKKWGFVDEGEMVRCSQCEEVYHQSCHEPPVPKEELEDTQIPWYCRGCIDSEASIGSILAESLHTALERKPAKKQGKRRRSTRNMSTTVNGIDHDEADEPETTKPQKKRQKTVSESNSGAEDGSETTTVAQELKALRDQLNKLEKEKLTMQKKLDQVETAQKTKGTEMDKLKEAVDGLKAGLPETQPSSPIHGWIQKATKRVTAFRGA